MVDWYPRKGEIRSMACRTTVWDWPGRRYFQASISSKSRDPGMPPANFGVHVVPPLEVAYRASEPPMMNPSVVLRKLIQVSGMVVTMVACCSHVAPPLVVLKSSLVVTVASLSLDVWP